MHVQIAALWLFSPQVDVIMDSSPGFKGKEVAKWLSTRKRLALTLGYLDGFVRLTWMKISY